MKEKKHQTTPRFKCIGMLLTLALILIGQVAQAQSKQVTGVVKDATGETVIGASVLEKGTPSNGTITDMDGNFKLTVSSGNATLQISFVGYQTQEISLNGKSSIAVTLKEDSEMLEEVVVVGYGAQKKESVIGAISQVSSKDLLSTPAANVSQAIAGKIPGVITSQTSGAPGADDAQIFIRGRATFAGDAQPLILVDGVERAFSQIAPDDIETISVLKDASATAVYGVRGANGVMLITTKRGKEQKPEVSLTANWQIQSPTRGDTYLNSYQSVVLLEEALRNDGINSWYSDNDIEMYRKSVAGQLSGVDAMLYPNVNWYDEVLNSTAPAQRYNVSIRGGTKRMRYYASGEFYDQTSMYKNLSNDAYGNKSSLNFRRYAFRANTDFFLTKDLTFSVNFGTRFEERRGPKTTERGDYSEVFYEINHTPGWIFPVAYEVQSGETTRSLYGGSSQYQNNIVAALAEGGYYRSVNTINETNFIVDYKLDWLTEGLSVKGMLSFDYENEHRRNYTKNFATYELNNRDNYNSIDAYNKFNTDTELAYGSSFTSIYKLYMEAQVNYARKFGKHDVTGMMLYMQNDYRNKAELAERYQGIVGRVTYGYDDRYLFEFNAGYNGSENFMKGKRFGFFPSVALGWLMSEEPWMEPLKNTFDKIKFRASMGQAGNDNIGGRRFAYLTTLKTDASGYTWGTTGQKNYDKGITEGEIGVTNLTWETATKSNLGLEVGLWNALDITVDVFREKRKNIFMQRRIIPTQTGFITNPWANYGKVTNGGMEVSINLHKQLNKDWFTSFYGNFTFAKNRVDEYDEAPSKIGTYRGQTGRSMNELWGLTAERLFTADDFESDGSLKFGIPKQEVGADKLYPGDIKYVDMNGDGKITEEDEGYIGGTEDPRIVYGFGGVIAYKNIDFNFFFQGTADAHRVIGNSTIFLPGSGTTVQGNAYSENLDDRWTDDNQDPYAFWPRLTYGPNKNNYRASTWWKKDMSFLRLKTVEIGYTFPKKWMEKIYSKGARVFVSGNNLLCFSPFKLWDPELGTNNGLKYPMNRSILFGIDINF